MKKRTAFKDLGISSSATISQAYWDKKKAQQERWEKEDNDRKLQEYWNGSISGQLKKKEIKRACYCDYIFHPNGC